MYTFDEQSTDRIADSVRWTEKFTSRQARRPEFVHLEAASSTILLGETEQAVANGGFGTALLFEGAAGSETVGSVQVHFVNATGHDLEANAGVWLCWPAIDGDHSAEAESYWYVFTGAFGGATRTWAVLTPQAPNNDYTPSTTPTQLILTKTAGTDNVTVDASGNITITGNGQYRVGYALTFAPPVGGALRPTHDLPPGSIRLCETALLMTDNIAAYVQDVQIYSGSLVFVPPDENTAGDMARFTATSTGVVQVTANSKVIGITMSVQNKPEQLFDWTFGGELIIGGLN